MDSVVLVDTRKEEKYLIVRWSEENSCAMEILSHMEILCSIWLPVSWFDPLVRVWASIADFVLGSGSIICVIGSENVVKSVMYRVVVDNWRRSD